MTDFDRSWLRSMAIALLVCVCLVASPAQADDNSSYCRAVTARATGDASLLMTPKAIAQGFRVPAADESQTETGGMTGGAVGVEPGQWEVRTGLGWSPSDFYKGVETITLGNLDCSQHEIEATVDRLLAQAQDAGRLPALKKQVAFLDAHRAEWQEIAKREQERFAARVISVIDLNVVLLHIVGLERQLAQSRGDAERLDAREYVRPPAGFDAMEARLLYDENEYEKRFSRIRTLTAFNVLVVGGTVDYPSPVGFYGEVELAFNLGWFLQYGKENEYLDARAKELKNAKYERAWKLRSFQKELVAARKEAQSELEIVERQLSAIATTRHTLEVAETPNVLHAIASLKVDEISAGSEQAYLRTLVDELTSYLAPDVARVQ
jgi:hypothetical protein